MKSALQLILLGMLLSVTALSYAQKERKIMFIGIDGLRSDALQLALTPNLDALFANGISTYDSWNLGITVSGPAWTSMLTGTWEPKHGVTGNSYNGANFIDYPYFPTRLKEINPDLYCVQIITWNPFDDASKGTGGYIYNSNWDNSIDAGDYGQGLVTEAAKVQLQNPDVDVMFIHYDECDGAGHGSGFSPLNPVYMNAIQQVDAEIGEVVAAIKARPTYDQEEWIICGTTDHGGNGTGHGGNSNNERHIWFYISGDILPNTTLEGPDPGSYQMPDNPIDPALVATTPVQVDIAVSILDWMLPGTNPTEIEEWQLDGKSWIPNEIANSVPVISNSSQLMVSPNPTNSNINVVLEGKEIEKIQLISTTGQILLQSTSSNISLEGLNSGLYIIRVQADNGTIHTQTLIKN